MRRVNLLSLALELPRVFLLSGGPFLLLFGGSNLFLDLRPNRDGSRGGTLCLRVIIFADAVIYPTAKRAVFLLKQWRNVFRPCCALMSRQKRSDLDIRAQHGTLCAVMMRSIMRES